MLLCPRQKSLRVFSFLYFDLFDQEQLFLFFLQHFTSFTMIPTGMGLIRGCRKAHSKETVYREATLGHTPLLGTWEYKLERGRSGVEYDA